MKNVSFRFKGRKISVAAKECRGIRKFIGLMFKQGQKANALIFSFEKPVRIKIHSFFVFFPFLAVWLDDRNNVVDLKSVKPFSLIISSKKRFSKLIEIPINNRYSKEIKLLVGD